MSQGHNNIHTSLLSNTTQIRLAKLDDHADQEAILCLLDLYARDPMGAGRPLDDDVRSRLINGLQKFPTTVIFLAFDGDRPVGLANCFLGFSTFAAAPLLNIHDLAVDPACRGQGIGRQLLTAIERHAEELGCCKLTLEVLENNSPAKGLYESFGFQQMDYGLGAGGALFMSKPIPTQK